jgi:hypothetical protein
MNSTLRRCTRPLALIVLALALTPIISPPARAQAPPEAVPIPGENQGEGRPLDGYFGTFVLSFMALWVVCRSARR